MQRALVLAALLSAPITALAASSPAVSAPAGADSTADAFDVVEIRTEDQLVLEGSFYAPRKGKQLVPAVLLVHEAGADRTTMSSLAERLQKQGLAALTLDLRGHGGSVQEKADWRALDEDGQRALWAQATKDVEAAAHWLLSREGIHSTKLSLVGHKSGCALVARHATRDMNVTCMALVSPRAESLGFNVVANLIEIEGLPTYVVAPRGEQPGDTEAMVREAQAATGGGNPYIEFWLCPNKKESPLEDRKTATNIAKFVQDQVSPKRSRD